MVIRNGWEDFLVGWKGIVLFNIIGSRIFIQDNIVQFIVEYVEYVEYVILFKKVFYDLDDVFGLLYVFDIVVQKCGFVLFDLEVGEDSVRVFFKIFVDFNKYVVNMKDKWFLFQFMRRMWRFDFDVDFDFCLQKR